MSRLSSSLSTLFSLRAVLEFVNLFYQCSKRFNSRIFINIFKTLFYSRLTDLSNLLFNFIIHNDSLSLARIMKFNSLLNLARTTNFSSSLNLARTTNFSSSLNLARTTNFSSLLNLDNF